MFSSTLPRRPWLPILAAILALLLSGLPAALPSAEAISPDVVISQVYGGGGNSGATYTHDFIELFNRGTAAVSLAGWSVQYTSATGTGNFGSATNLITPLPAVTLRPGRTFWCRKPGRRRPTPLPARHVTDLTPVNMSGTGGKVVIAGTRQDWAVMVVRCPVRLLRWP